MVWKTANRTNLELKLLEFDMKRIDLDCQSHQSGIETLQNFMIRSAAELPIAPIWN